MRITLNLSLFAFVGLIGVAGTASARPDHEGRGERPVVQERVGNPPERILRMDARHLRDDGRGDTGSSARPELIQYRPETSGRLHDSGYRESNFAAPFKSELVNHIEMRTPVDEDPKASSPTSKPSPSQDQGTARNPFAESKGPPIELKSDISMKVHQGEGREDGQGGAKLRNDSERARTARSDDARSITYPQQIQNNAAPPFGFKAEIAAHAKSGNNGDITDEK